MKRSARLLVVIVLGLVGLAMIATFTIVRFGTVAYTNDDDLPLQVRNLENMVAVLESDPPGQESLLRVSISEPGLQELAAALVGIEVEFPSLSNTRIVLSELSIATDPGELRVSLTITGTSPEISGEVALSGTGAILFDHFERPENDSTVHAVYQVHIERLEPAFRLGWLSLRTRKWAEELLRSHAIEEFGEVLKISVPVPMMPDIALGFDREDTTFIEDTGANYVIRSTLPDSKLAWPISVRIPIPAADGLHVIADTPRNDQQSVGAIANAPTAQLALQRDELLAKVRSLVTRLPVLRSPLELSVHRTLFERLLEQVNELPESSRTARFQLVSRQGRLVDEIHDAAVVGKGGYYVEFKSQDSGSGTIKIGNMTTAWSEAGLTLTTRIAAKASARLNVYIDPYIGGGFDFEMGVDGNASSPVSIALDARKISSGEHSAFVLGPVVSCAQFPLTVEGGGSVKFGVEMHELIGEDPMNPTILLTDFAQRVPLLSEANNAQIRHSASYIELSLVPQSVDISDQGYVFRSELKIARQVGAIPTSTEQGDVPREVSSALTSEWMRQVAPSCPTPSPTKFMFAGQDFGPNNEIVKALQAIGRSIDLTKHNAKVAWDDVETVVKDPGKAPAKVAEILGRGGQELGRLGHRLERDVAKPIGKVAKKLKKKLRF